MSETQSAIPASATAPPVDVGEMLRRHRTKPVDPGTAAAVTAPSAAEPVAPAETGDSHLRAAQEAMAKLQQPEPKPQQTSSEQTWGSLAMAVGALGGLLTHTPLTTSLNAMAGVKKAVDAGDNARAQEEHDRWKTAQAALSKVVEYQLKESDLILKEKDPRRQLAATNTFIAQFKLDAMQKLFEQNGHDPVATLKAYNAAMRKGSAGMDAAAGAVSGPAGGGEAAKLAEGLGSEDPSKQADAVDQMRAMQRRLSAGKGSTASTRTEELASDVRWAGVAAALRSGDPIRVKEAQQEAAKLAGGMGGGLHAPREPTVGSSAATQAAVEKDVQAAHPEWTPGQVATAAKRAVSDSNHQTMGDDAAKLMAQIAIQTGHPPAWMSRSEASMRKFLDTYAAEARNQGVDAKDISANMVRFNMEMAEARTLGSQTARVDFAARELEVALPQALELSEIVFRPGFRPLAEIQQAIQGQTSDPDLLEFMQQNRAVISAYAMAMQRGGVSTVNSMDRAEHMLRTATSQQGYARQLDRLNKEVQTIQYGSDAAKRDLLNEITGGRYGNAPPPKLTGVPRAGGPGRAPALEQWLEEARPRNPSVSDDDLIAYYKKTHGGG